MLSNIREISAYQLLWRKEVSTKPSALLPYISKDCRCIYWSNQSSRLSKGLSFFFHNQPWQRIIVVCLVVSQFKNFKLKEISLTLLQFNLRVSFSFSTLKKILENSHSHSQLSKNSLRTLILILNSQKNPWEISFSISTLSTLTLAEVWNTIGLLLIVQSTFRVPSPGLSVEIKTWRKMRPVQANANSDIETPQANSLKGYTKR